jgi:hypothetical protein
MLPKAEQQHTEQYTLEHQTYEEAGGERQP